MGEKSVSITFQPVGAKVVVPENTTVLEAARQNDILLEVFCNGSGKCGKCMVKASGILSQPTAHEKQQLGDKLRDGWRLACQTKVIGEAVVSLPQKQVFHTVQSGRVKQYEFDPIIKKVSALAQNLIAQSRPIYGVAVDIGTTSIVTSLVDLSNDGREIATEQCLNPQTKYGADVITRITHAHQGVEDTNQLKNAVLNGINQLIEKICDDQAINPDQIVHVAVAGNTTMLHLLLGIDPISLALAPYTPVFVDYQEHTGAEIGLRCASTAIVSLLPCLSAFIGADILAGMLAIDFHREQVPALFIDIGTNGEIGANVGGRLVATSSAAGPALEGMNIEFGCRAEDGAISGVKIGESGEFVLETIGQAKSKGLCGSGLVELVAELVTNKVILAHGGFAEPQGLPPFLAERLVEYNGQKAFMVEPTAGIVLTQKDVRQVQLAKGAIAAAIEILFQRLEADLGSVAKVYIAGAFGYHLKPEALRTIGLLPPGLNGEIDFVGNTAKEGARLCLLSQIAFEEIQALQKELDPLELSYAPEFMYKYVEHMNFPHQPDFEEVQNVK